jgi:hypothetical protein
MLFNLHKTKKIRWDEKMGEVTVAIRITLYY